MAKPAHTKIGWRIGPEHAVHEAGAPVLEVSGVSAGYGRRPALEDVSFQLAAGERVALVGPNGAGKSTLFRVIAGLLEPAAGRIRIFGESPGRHICIAYVPQRAEIDWSFPVTVYDVVLMGRSGQLGFLKKARRSDRDLAMACIERVGLADVAYRQIGELSGGQQQRMFVARALAQEAELVLMDEPLTGVDMASQETLFRLIGEISQGGGAVMVATHDLNLAATRFDRIGLLNRRLIGFGKPEEVLTTEKLTTAYGDHLRMVRTADGVLMISDTCGCGGAP